MDSQVEVNNFVEYELESQKKYEFENLWRLIFRLTLPAVMMLAFNAANDVTDALIAAYMIPNNTSILINSGLTQEVLTQSVVSASAYDSNIMYIAIGISTLISIGSEIKFSKLLSTNNQHEARELIGTSFTNTFLICLLIFILFEIITPQLVTVLHGGNYSPVDNYTISIATQYIRVELTWIFFFSFTDLIIKYLRAEGKSLMVSAIASITLPINILFDFLFLGPIGLNLIGCGLGSLMGETISFGLIILYIFNIKKKSFTNLFDSRISYKPTKIITKSIMAISLPIFISSIIQSLNSFSITSFSTSLQLPDNINFDTNYIANYVINDLNEDTFYSSSIAIYTEMNALMFWVILGTTQLCGSIIGFNYHQGNIQRAKKASIISIFYIFIYMLFFEILFQSLMPQFFSLWSLPDWPIQGIQFSRILLMRTLFIGVTYSMIAMFTAFDKIKLTYLSLSISNIFVFYITVGIFFGVFKDNSDIGYYMFAASLSIAEVITIIIISPLYVKVYKSVNTAKVRQN